MQDSLTILGVMSGTSLDGVDLALCQFSANGKQYRILRAETIDYPGEWKQKLREAEKSSGAELIVSDREYGRYLGNLCRNFLGGEHADYIASHGHTIYHEPAKGITFQLGHGAAIAAVSGVKTVCDFRTTDVALGGQGAPLVPIGDALLFSEYRYCLNLGGFANISYEENGQRKAYDVAPLNYVLNRLAQREGKEYDEGGAMSAAGQYIAAVADKLDALPFYHTAPPKSLGREWVEQNVFPLMNDSLSSRDLMHTFVIHATKQIAAACNQTGKMLVTGGGTFNDFFIRELRTRAAAEIVIPDVQTIKFKEALVFALLGYLRVNEQVNALASVTGASRDSCGGTIYLPG